MGCFWNEHIGRGMENDKYSLIDDLFQANPYVA
jgi:hypothetical protein